MLCITECRMKRATIAVDGASKGNPGPAGIGIVIADESGKVIAEISEYIGQSTNNVAEYTALVRGLSEALHMGFEHAVIATDSELMARQLSGKYRVKSPDIAPLFDSVLDLMGRFKTVSVNHVTRDKNKQADKLASKAASSGAQPALITEEVAETKPDAGEGRMIVRLSVRTAARTEFVDITRDVQDAVKQSGVTDGVCIVYVPHTTAGITINENADPDVTRDIIDTIERLVPRGAGYRHVEGNADSHVKASLMGFSVSVLVENGRLVLGAWQGIYFCEFDGPRNRKVYVRVG
jgi:secondary thiamine-phosphate synthase enzyme